MPSLEMLVSSQQVAMVRAFCEYFSGTNGTRSQPSSEQHHTSRVPLGTTVVQAQNDDQRMHPKCWQLRTEQGKARQGISPACQAACKPCALCSRRLISDLTKTLPWKNVNQSSRHAYAYVQPMLFMSSTLGLVC